MKIKIISSFIIYIIILISLIGCGGASINLSRKGFDNSTFLRQQNKVELGGQIGIVSGYEFDERNISTHTILPKNAVNGQLSGLLHLHPSFSIQASIGSSFNGRIFHNFQLNKNNYLVSSVFLDYQEASDTSFVKDQKELISDSDPISSEDSIFNDLLSKMDPNSIFDWVKGDSRTVGIEFGHVWQYYLKNNEYGFYIRNSFFINKSIYSSQWENIPKQKKDSHSFDMINPGYKLTLAITLLNETEITGQFLWYKNNRKSFMIGPKFNF